MTKYCDQCGEENKDSAIFCNNCGTKFDKNIVTNNKNGDKHILFKRMAMLLAIFSIFVLFIELPQPYFLFRADTLYDFHWLGIMIFSIICVFIGIILINKDIPYIAGLEFLALAVGLSILEPFHLFSTLILLILSSLLTFCLKDYEYNKIIFVIPILTVFVSPFLSDLMLNYFEIFREELLISDWGLYIFILFIIMIILPFILPNTIKDNIKQYKL